jgi:hypothetical protein
VINNEDQAAGNEGTGAQFDAVRKHVARPNSLSARKAASSASKTSRELAHSQARTIRADSHSAPARGDGSRGSISKAFANKDTSLPFSPESAFVTADALQSHCAPNAEGRLGLRQALPTISL